MELNGRLNWKQIKEQKWEKIKIKELNWKSINVKWINL